MRKCLHRLSCLLLIIPFVLNSCKKDSEENAGSVSEVGTWNISDVEYYYDGKLLDYKDFEITIWPTSQRWDCGVFVSQGGFVLNGDGTGKVFGMGEFGTDEFDLTYTKEGNIIRVSIKNKGVDVTADLKLENNKLKNSCVDSEIYGWGPEDSDEVFGADGNATHILETVQIYTKR